MTAATLAFGPAAGVIAAVTTSAATLSLFTVVSVLFVSGTVRGCTRLPSLWSWLVVSTVCISEFRSPMLQMGHLKLRSCSFSTVRRATMMSLSPVPHSTWYDLWHFLHRSSSSFTVSPEQTPQVSGMLEHHSYTAHISISYLYDFNIFKVR